MTPLRRTRPPLSLRPIALIALIGLFLAGTALAQANPPRQALAAADPAHASAQTLIELPAPVDAASPALPADLAQAREIWRRTNERVAEFPRGHIDLLRWETRQPGSSAAATPAPGPELTLAEARRLSLRQRPDLFTRAGMNEPARAEVQVAYASHWRELQRRWIDAVVARQSARFMDEALEAARTGTELGRRMVSAGNWSQARLMREQLVEAAAWQAATDARTAARSAVERLARELGEWEASAVVALGERLPTSLPALPAQPAPGTDTSDLEAAVLRSHPRLALQRAALQQHLQALPADRWAAWDRAVDAALQTSHEGQAPNLDPRSLLGDHALERAVNAQAELLRLGAERRSMAREAWAAVLARHASAQHSEAVVSRLQTALEQETTLRYNGMLQSTWELLASARERMAALDAALKARGDYWRAQADWQALLAGADYAGAAPSSSAAPAANASAGH